MDPGRHWPTVRSQGKRLVVWLVAAVIVLVAVGLVYASDPYEASPGSVEAVEADDRVVVEASERGYVLRPAGESPEVGLVFYPGGLVAPEAYVGSLAGLVRRTNVAVVIPRMPLHLAVVDYGLGRTGLLDHAAEDAMARHPSVERWYVGGHSLGGTMACRYARDHPDAVEGVVLYAAYCDVDISDTDLAALAVAGSGDAVMNRRAFDRNRRNLPPTAQVEVVEGLNHTQFGSYTGGDRPSGTSFEDAHARLDAVVAGWLENETAGGSIRPASPSPRVEGIRPASRSPGVDEIRPSSLRSGSPAYTTCSVS